MLSRKVKKNNGVISKIKEIKLSKRQEFVIITLFLTFFLIITQNMSSIWRFISLFFLSFLAYFLSAFGLREDLKKVEWFALLILPLMFTISLAVFYFLLPVRWLTRIPFAILYAIGIYATLLVENIYNVAVNRSIQLLRVAHAVGFLITITTLFLLFNTLFSFHLTSFYNLLFTLIIVFPLSLQALWAIKLTEESIGWDVFLLSIFFSLIIGEAAFIISFWPLNAVLTSLFLSTAFYGLIGSGQLFLGKRLFRKNVIEYLQVFLLIFILVLFTVNYRN